MPNITMKCARWFICLLTVTAYLTVVKEGWWIGNYPNAFSTVADPTLGYDDVRYLFDRIGTSA